MFPRNFFDAIYAQYLGLSFGIPHTRLDQLVYLALHRVILLLKLADLVDGVPQVGVVHLGMGRLNLLEMLAGIV